MRKILIFLSVLVLFVSSAVALPYFGPPQGFHNRGSITLDGDLTIAGNLEVGGTNITNGLLVDDLTLDEDVNITANAGDSVINMSLADGFVGELVGNVTGDLTGNASDVLVGNIINTGYGLKNLSNNIIVNITATKGLKFGTGAELGALQLNMTADKGLEFGTGAALGALQIKLDGSTLSLGSSGLKVTDNTYAGKLLSYYNETGINTTLSKMVSGSSSINASTSISTVLTSANLKTVYPMDGSAGHVTLTLPDAATNAGRMYMVVLAADMDGNNVIVDTTGAGNLGGASGPDSLTTTDAAAALTVISDGTNYLVINKDGTWS